jgi:tRNA threonylcarbamoyl adenosine modification protein (Sua5/YciO/YrdC/YwlC family)
MPAEILVIHPDNPEPRKIKQVADVIRRGGVVIYPTDTVYGLGCQIGNTAAVERIATIRGIKVEKARFSIMCADLSDLALYTKPIDQATYKLLKRTLPGPFTFILPASNQVPKILAQNRKTLGFRISANPICLDMLKSLGTPIITSSLKNDDDSNPYPNEFEDVEALFGKRVDLIINAGPSRMEPSTIVDVTDPAAWSL